MFNLIKALDRYLGGFERLLLIALTALLTLILCSQVLLRYFFDLPLFWAEEVSVQLLLMISFIGVSYLIFLDRMVRVDFLLMMLPEPLHAPIHRLLNLVALLTLMVLCVLATQWILRPEVGIDVSPTTDIPTGYNYVIMVCSFYAMAFHQGVKLFFPKSSDDHSGALAHSAEETA